MEIESPLYDAQDVAKYLNVHEMTVYRWMKKGVIPAFKIGGRWRVQKAKLENFLLKKLEEREL